MCPGEVLLEKEARCDGIWIVISGIDLISTRNPKTTGSCTNSLGRLSG